MVGELGLGSSKADDGRNVELGLVKISASSFLQKLTGIYSLSDRGYQRSEPCPHFHWGRGRPTEPQINNELEILIKG